ncbi:alpha/beta fold hydrolase [Phenylobacterium terrae]|uniref:Alpha/beta fold hydrolase n=1 Tax=Phenylobacterium terrae TaxID=2665495 RepID=A0ABW4MWC7_9CAUL
MIEEQRFGYRGEDGAEIAAFRWTGSAPAKAVIQLAHGAGEHSLRYLEPLTPIIEAGYVLYSADHRGHGATAGPDRLGDFGPGGAAAAISDMAVLSKKIRADHAGLPLILFGHSMGAAFAQVYLTRHHGLIDALVLSGTAATWLPRGERRDPNSAFENPRTPYDWLSRDTAEVDKYIADPLCGIRFTPESGASFRTIGEQAADPGYLNEVRKGLPVYIFVGDEDPINDKLARVTPLVDRYREAGLDVTFKVYPGGRHEMLNETNRAEVVADLKAWLDRVAG